MISQKKYLIIFLVIAVGGATIGGLIPEEDKIIQVDFELEQGFPDPVPQHKKNRTWRVPITQKIVTISSSGNQILYEPRDIQVDKQGNIYVYDFGSKTIKKYSKKGFFVKEYLHGEGRGPGEAINPTDFDVTEDGHVWICDMYNSRITEFDTEGKIAHTIHPETLPLRLAVFDTNLIYTMNAVNAAKLFETYSQEGERLNRFGRWIESQAQRAMVLDGWIDTDQSGNLIYSGLRTGLLASYSPEGELRYFRRTIDPIPLPKLTKTARGFTRIDNSQRATQSINITKNNIHLLAVTDSSGVERTVLDTYDISNGDYLYSRRIPGKYFSKGILAKHLFYAIEDTVVSVWEM